MCYPLGAISLCRAVVTPAQLACRISVRAQRRSSGALAAGFLRQVDRKKLLLFFYGGFLIGTTMCAVAPDYNNLLIARIITGIFGGVMSSVSLAIITDVFKLEVRGRVMGFVQMAFASSQVLGIPIGLYFAEKINWHFPFVMM